MSTPSENSGFGYEHTQKAPLYLLMFAIAALLVALAWATSEWAIRGLMLGMSLFFFFVGVSFRQLTVREDGEHLLIAFGPLALFSRRISYVSIQDATAGRTSLIEGWGIHLSPKGGWVWNLWGRDCVDVTYDSGKRIRIGTDDVIGLLQHLRGKIGSND